MKTNKSDNSEGRNRFGRFVAGNHHAIGNPMAKRVQCLRVALLEAITPKDVATIIQAVVERAKAGDMHAARLIFDRTLGPPAPLDLLERLELLEEHEARLR